MGVARAHLLLLSEREALAWVIQEQRMAFASHRAASARTLAVGHRLFLYTTRGCFHNPTRDRGRIIAEAVVGSSVTELADPIELAGRTFTVGCRLRIPRVAPLRTGVELAPLVPRLDSFPDAAAWTARMRQTLVPLAEPDISVIAALLEPFLRPRDDVLDHYLEAARASAVSTRR
jgi:hypothetical protein